ncbi:MAG: methylmalonyl-CoA mutase, partial [Planctomycetes bacterium]|nr:methylmalonyl-CoA mutase [Planctomycetota bacterium]
VDKVDIPVYVMTSEYGAASQLEKIDMLDFAQLVALNKFERPGSEDALRDIKKQVWRNRGANPAQQPAEMPVFPTIASLFNDPGVNAFYQSMLAAINAKAGTSYETTNFTKVPADGVPRRKSLIPANRQRYLAEISETLRGYHKWVGEQKQIASSIYCCFIMLYDLGDTPPCRLESFEASKLTESGIAPEILALRKRFNELTKELDPKCREMLAATPELFKAYTDPENVYVVRGKEIRVENYRESLSHLKIPKVKLPSFSDWGDLLAWLLKENVPGGFPYTAGVFPYKREGEDPARMFAGEGPPAQTNARVHLLSEGQPAARLSTAFDSVTLYGEDPHERPDIYGKVGESGVSVCSVEDAEILYSGFDLCSPKTSVSMTINGPAPMILAFFMNTAIRQQVRKHLMESGKLKAARGGEIAWNDPRNFDQKWEEIRPLLDDAQYESIRAATLSQVRGTVQADILKEDQAQNTCIFSTEFALRMMGDVQSYFIDHQVRNYYSVSISGYHIAEAGANPISQLAFTLANGFTYAEYYLSRGMKIDDFAPNLSFFFSNGLDPEYAVIGRVARRIWAVAMKRLYGANERSQML